MWQIDGAMWQIDRDLYGLSCGRLKEICPICHKQINRDLFGRSIENLWFAR